MMEIRCDSRILSICVLLAQVTTGEEGFWAQGSPWVPFNPWSGDLKSWGSGTGQDFSAQHALSSIDFAVIHLWPDNWSIVNGGVLPWTII
jgi:hypothetical protein